MKRLTISFACVIALILASVAGAGTLDDVKPGAILKPVLTETCSASASLTKTANGKAWMLTQPRPLQLLFLAMQPR